MKIFRSTVLLAPVAIGLSLLAGCSHPVYYGPPPPPPPPVAYGAEVPPLVQLADRNGMHTGFDDGARDAYYHAGYAPRHRRAYRDAPGYDYRLGPIGPYVAAFRTAYLRGYDQGFNGR